jgi:paraquat-inducible protein B
VHERFVQRVRVDRRVSGRRTRVIENVYSNRNLVLWGKKDVFQFNKLESPTKKRARIKHNLKNYRRASCHRAPLLTLHLVVVGAVGVLF